MTLEKLAEIEALLDGESDYHSVFITGEPVPSWALDVKTMRAVLAAAKKWVEIQDQEFVVHEYWQKGHIPVVKVSREELKKMYPESED